MGKQRRYNKQRENDWLLIEIIMKEEGLITFNSEGLDE